MSVTFELICTAAAWKIELGSAWRLLRQSRLPWENTKLAFDYRLSRLFRVCPPGIVIEIAHCDIDMRMADPDLIETFTYLVTELKNRHPNMAYLHAGEPRVGGGNDLVAAEGDSLEFLVSHITLWDF